MSDFWLLVELGFSHVWDWQGYDHLLFLAAQFVCPFQCKTWKKLFVAHHLFYHWTQFVLGHRFARSAGGFFDLD